MKSKKTTIFFYIASLLAILYANQCYSKSVAREVQCRYRVTEKVGETNIKFSLPESIKFGLLIPIDLSVDGDKGSSTKMNTVVLKDNPYLVLSDVYKMQSKTTFMAFFVFAPDLKSIQVIHLHVGKNSNSKFIDGSCKVN